uniref:CBM2 domain-containing protein n=1 Tax=Meloidogyne hapla TaxID=6305 RepID=A0A1I8BH06_MELHA
MALFPASGGGEPDEASMNDWWNFWDKNKISYLNWAVDNKGEGSAALNPNTVASDVGTPSHWSKSGQIVQDHLKKMTNGVSCSGKPNNSGSSPPKSNNKNNGTVSKNKGGNNNKGGNTNNNNKNGGKISISLNVDSSWGNGANYKIIIKNTGTSAICSVTFQVTPVGKQTINVWNAKSLSGGKYSISNIKINAGGTNNEIGMGVSGSSKAPKISLINIGKC